MKKRLLGVFFAVFLLLSWSGSLAVLGDNADISIVECEVDNEPVRADEHFNLTLTLENNSGDDLEDIYFILDADTNFYFPNSTSKKKLDDELGEDEEETYSDELELVYNGKDDNKLSFTIRYTKDGATEEMEDFIYIDAVPEDEDTPSSTEKQPKLSVMGGTDIPVAEAGETVKLPLQIENTSRYAAKDITITPDFGEGTDIPFELDKMKTAATISKLNAGDAEKITFSFNVLASAADKVYPIKLIYSYANSSGKEYTSAEMVYVRILSDSSMPKVIIERINYGGKALTAGEPSKVTLLLRNEGKQKAKDIKATLAGLKSGGFTVHDATDTRLIKVLEGDKTAALEYLLIPSGEMESGNHDLELKLSYKDEKGTAYTDESRLFLPVQGQDEVDADLSITNIEVPQAGIRPEQDFKVAFDVMNNGEAGLNNVKVSLNTDKELISKSQSIRSIKLPGKGSQRVEFVLGATSEAVTKNYPIQIQVEYETGTGAKKEKHTISQYIGVYINGDGSKSTPRIIIDRYQYEPQVIKGGDTLSMDISLLNTSETLEVRNIKVSLASEEGIFNPVDSSNTFYIEAIGPGGRVEKTQALQVKYDAAHKTYGITVNIDYEDSKGTQYNAKDMISVPVIQVPKLVLGDMNLPPELFVGQPIPLSVEFFNMGKSTLNNLMIKAEGNFDMQNSSYYVGNFESGRSDVYEVTLIPMQEGQCAGRVLFYFEDGAGQPVEVTKEIAFTAAPVPQAPPMEGEGMEGPEKQTLWTRAREVFKNPVIAVETAVIAAGAAAFIIRRIRKRKKGMELDE